MFSSSPRTLPSIFLHCVECSATDETEIGSLSTFPGEDTVSSPRLRCHPVKSVQSPMLRRPYRSSRPLAARLSARIWKPPPTEIRNEYIPRIVCLSSIVRTPCFRSGLGTDRLAMAPAYDL